MILRYGPSLIARAKVEGRLPLCSISISYVTLMVLNLIETYVEPSYTMQTKFTDIHHFS